IDYEHPALSAQHRTFSVGQDDFAKDIAGARTYCFLHEVEALKELGLIKGGSLDNAIVIGDEGVLNDSIRFPDEFVRHKILDLLGDLMLLGMPLRAHVIALKSGHASHVKFTNLIRERINNTGAEKKIVQETKKEVDVAPIPVGEDIVIDSVDIQKVLPHRYPMLLVDRITSLIPDQYIVGIKNVTVNEPCFTGHWPGNPVMPGVLMIEAMAQVGGVLLLSKPERRGLNSYFMGIDKAKFRRPVVPGDQLVFRVEIVKLRSKVAKVKGVAMVDGQIAVEADLQFYMGK
ncbi:3-hydroxyacyl-ACP dehydratase FabZ, partial [Candidatus Hydrogenedentota bacterium]